MLPNREIERLEEQLPGERLNRILDQARFKRVRGRSVDLYEFLNKHCPDEWDLKLSTVRSWFSKSAPPMKKIIHIIELLDEHYGFTGNPELKAIQGWWKVGGPDPFENAGVKTSGENARKLDFLLPSLILDQIGDNFSKFSSAELDEVKDFAINFAMAFNDPNIRKCPEEYLKMAIIFALNKIKNKD